MSNRDTPQLLGLTSAQYGIWSGQQLDPNSPDFNAGGYVELRGPLDVALLERAVRTVVDQTQALKVRFHDGPSGPVQTHVDDPDWPFPVIDLSSVPDPRTAATAWARENLARVVKLAEEPAFTQALLVLGEEHHWWYQQAHHIALDGYAHVQLIKQVARVYTALVTGAPLDMRSFAPLSEVVAEDAAYLSSPQIERDRDFWFQLLEQAGPPASLSQHAAEQSRGFIRQGIRLAPRQLQTLTQAVRQGRAVWSEAMIAALGVYLCRRIDTTAAVIGLPVMNRFATAALRTPCMAMNIVPLPVQAAPLANLTQLAADTATTLRRIRPHQLYRYEQLRRDLGLVGSDRRLFSTVVNIMPFDQRLAFHGCAAILHNLSAGPVDDLAVSLRPDAEGGLHVDLDANPARYRDSELVGHLDGFQELLETLTANPGSPLARVWSQLHSPPADAVLDGGQPSLQSRPVMELIAEQADTTPNRVAVEDGSDRLNYVDLLHRAEQLATVLVASGVGEGPRRSPIAVLLPRGADAVTSFLAVLLSGAAYLPLDPAGPVERNATILQDAEVTFLVTTSEFADKAAGHGIRTLLIDQLPAVDSVRPFPVTAPTDPAYVIYTSGSTGRPNGVVISHGALASFVAAVRERYDIGPDERVLQFAPLHFDASVEEIFLTLSVGATLVVRSEQMTDSVTEFLAECAQRAITVLDLPTAFWHEVVYALSAGARLPESVRTVIIGGEAALPERVNRWHRHAPSQVRLINTYGPTEATVVATSATLRDQAPVGMVPIGQPLPGIRAVVLDSADQPVAISMIGELHLTGPTLANGYLNQPQLDAQRFVRLWALPDAPLAYRTGDLVRYDSEGSLHFIGRRDDEVKISGHRIDPLEIEAVLLAQPGVQEAALTTLLTPTGPRLRAHLVLEPGSPVDAVRQLRERLHALLPAPSVPGSIEVVQALPRNTSGKIDRKLLAQRPLPSPVHTDEKATALERAVLAVWSEVLGQSGLSVTDDFFTLGGQSLQTIQAANRLSARLNRQISATLLFRNPTAAGLAAALGHSPVERPSEPRLPDQMLRDSILDPTLVFPDVSASASMPRRVLLTGATGFVGAHLLYQLLELTQDQVVCLVRATDQQQALERLRSTLRVQGLPWPTDSTRVTVLPADLALPMLGLRPGQYTELAESCHAIYHSAAVVSVVRSYLSLRGPNVVAVERLLRLAADAGGCPIHHVSTLATAPPSTVRAQVPEELFPAHQGLVDGYQQSKWVAEQLVGQAAERGLAASVYRLGRVMPASAGGVINRQDLLWRILLSGMRIGALPRLAVAEVWTPVDYVAQALVRLSLRMPANFGGVVNVAPNPPVPLGEVTEWVRDYGYPVRSLGLPEWCRELATTADEDAQATLAFFDSAVLGEAAGPSDLAQDIRGDRLHQALAQTDVVYPASDQELFRRCLDYCVQAGLLPAPVGR